MTPIPNRQSGSPRDSGGREPPPRHYLTTDVREALGETAERCENRSLWWDKFPGLAPDPKAKEWRSKTVGKFVRLPSAHRSLPTGPGVARGMAGVSAVSLPLQGDLVINHAVGVIENAGICLDRFWGIPFIPGSAVKGLAQAGAKECQAPPPERQFVFGWTSNSGSEGLPKELRKAGFSGTVVFFAAYPDGDPVLKPDVVTCHHPRYYRGDQGKPVATDDENPEPHAFPVVSQGSLFIFRLKNIRRPGIEVMCSKLGLPADFDPLAKAKEWLIAGLTVLGLGAKTAAGYGWFAYNAEEDRKRAEEAERAAQKAKEEKARVEAEAARRAALSPLDRETERIATLDDSAFAQLIGRLDNESELVQQAVLRCMSGARAAQWKDWKKRKTEKTKMRADILDNLARKHGIPLP